MSPLNKIQIGKMRLFLSIFIGGGLIILFLLIKWEFIDNEKFLAIANERLRQTKIPSIRGSILAGDGTTLAYSEPRFDAYVWLPDLENAEKLKIQTRDEFIIKVATATSTDNMDLRIKLASGPQWIKIANKLTQDQKSAVLGLKSDDGYNLRGVQFQYVNKRIYPENRLASQILGYVMVSDRGDGYKGVWGLEQYWDGLLKPQEGYQATEYDSFGNYIAIGEDETIEPKPGSTIYTTINKAAQASLEKYLKYGVETFKAKSATGIVVNPKTGEVYAMANYPDFDPNTYYTEPDINVFGNMAVSTPYEIGSVGKAFTISAAMDLGLVEPDTVLMPNGHQGCEVISPEPADVAICKNRSLNKTGKIVDCVCTFDLKPINQPITVATALISSDNVALRHVAMTMTYYQFYEYLLKFGVIQATKIDVAGESVGMIQKPEDWNYADQSVYSYGHGYSITPLEAIMGISALANNGIRMQPYVVSKIIDANNNTTSFIPKEVENVVKPSTCDKIIPIMNQVYLNQLREAKYKQYSKYYIALKSGTALIPYKDRAGYSNEINATFAGFDASPDRKFALLIRLEAPQVGDLSWENVRVVWLDVLVDLIDILKVQPYNPNTF